MKYDPALDGLRAVAISAVVACHLSPSRFGGGWAGVDVFFVLSGFLITKILDREMAITGSLHLGWFYINRALRLVPALVAVLIASICLSAFQYAGQLRECLTASLYAITYLMNWNIALGWAPSWHIGHTWSLAMEEQFYLLWPALFFVLPRRGRITVTAGLVVAVTLWRCYLANQGASADRTYNGFDTHSDALLVGCLLAFFLPAERLTTQSKALPIIAAAALLSLFAFIGQPWTYFDETAGITIATICSTLAIVAARCPNWFSRLLSTKPFVFTGQISYGWYLWHLPLLEVARPHLHGKWLFIPIVLSYGVAAVSRFTLEAYFLSLKKSQLIASRSKAALPAKR